jgi:hypothetical protein
MFNRFPLASLVDFIISLRSLRSLALVSIPQTIRTSVRGWKSRGGDFQPLRLFPLTFFLDDSCRSRSATPSSLTGRTWVRLAIVLAVLLSLYSLFRRRVEIPESLLIPVASLTFFSFYERSSLRGSYPSRYASSASLARHAHRTFALRLRCSTWSPDASGFRERAGISRPFPLALFTLVVSRRPQFFFSSVRFVCYGDSLLFRTLFPPSCGGLDADRFFFTYLFMLFFCVVFFRSFRAVEVGEYRLQSCDSFSDCALARLPPACALYCSF